MVFGKIVDMMEKIQQDTGSHVQVLNFKDERSQDKVCVVTGSPDQIQVAGKFIDDIIKTVLVNILLN